MDDLLLKEKENMIKYSKVRMTDAAFVELFNVTTKDLDDTLIKAGLSKECVLNGLLSYRSKCNTSIAFDIQMLKMISGLANDFIDNPQYKRELFVHEVVNYAAIFLGNVLGLDKF